MIFSGEWKEDCALLKKLHIYLAVTCFILTTFINHKDCTICLFTCSQYTSSQSVKSGYCTQQYKQKTLTTHSEAALGLMSPVQRI